MEFDKIKELIDIVDKSSLMELELKGSEEFYIKLSKRKKENEQSKDRFKNDYKFKENINTKYEQSKKNTKESIKDNINTRQNTNTEKNDTNYKIVKSPIVGVFYSSSSPTKPPFVKVGDQVKEGDTLCIIEAMKVMNEIKSPYSGKIAEIVAENESMVEYNQEIFKII